MTERFLDTIGKVIERGSFIPEALGVRSSFKRDLCEYLLVRQDNGRSQSRQRQQSSGRLHGGEELKTTRGLGEGNIKAEEADVWDDTMYAQVGEVRVIASGGTRAANQR